MATITIYVDDDLLPRHDEHAKLQVRGALACEIPWLAWIAVEQIRIEREEPGDDS